MFPGAQTDIKQCSLSDVNVVLVDLNMEDQDVISGMNLWITNIISTYSVDGVRIDTVSPSVIPAWHKCWVIPCSVQGLLASLHAECGHVDGWRLEHKVRLSITHTQL